MSKGKVRLHVQRGVGMTSVSFEAPAEDREAMVAAVKEVLTAMPESTFTGEGVVISSIPSHGPGMDGPQGFIRKPNDE